LNYSVIFNDFLNEIVAIGGSACCKYFCFCYVLFKKNGPLLLLLGGGSRVIIQVPDGRRSNICIVRQRKRQKPGDRQIDKPTDGKCSKRANKRRTVRENKMNSLAA